MEFQPAYNDKQLFHSLQGS